MKIPVLRRALMATAIATSLVSGTMIAAPAQAQFGGIVYDPSNYAQNVLTAARTLQQINNQIQQIQNQATSLINEARNLASLPVSTIQTLQQQVDQTRQLLNQAQRIAYVLRRKPPGELLPGAHAVDREAKVLSALGKAGFPVAHVHGLCTDDSVIGTWFYVMDMVEGRVFWDATLPDVPHEERAAYFDAMNAAMAQLHGFDPEAIGLGDYGKPGNYFARQIGRWGKQYLADELAGRNADMDAVLAWLQDNIPEGDETSVIHGDFRCDNMIFHPTEPRILAVLDWELSTLGHPLADFAYHAMMYRMPPDIVPGLGGADIAALGIPGEAEYVAAYCARTGRSGIPNYTFYLAFNLFRLAAIFHGIKGRVLRGTAANAQAASRAQAFPRLAQLAREALPMMDRTSRP